MLLFFFFFNGKMIKVVYAIIAITIKDLKMCFSNANLLLKKKVIYFEPLAQKEETDK